MIDFPASPTVGQTFTSGGVTWTWDGTKWTTGSATVAYLPLTGGTLSGSLSLNAASGTARNFNGETNGAFRWNMQFGNATPESGTAGGSDFALSRFDNTGAYIDSPLVILRGNGILVAADGISAPQAIGDNRIINGDMRVNQRGAASGTANGYTVDRWGYTNNTGAVRGTWQQGTSGLVALGWGNYLTFASSSAYALAASDAVVLWQAIESDMVTDFAWGTSGAQPVTLSFWAASTLTGTFGGCVASYSALRAYPFTYSIPAAGTWYKIVITVPGDTAGTWAMTGNSGALIVYFDLGSGASNRGPAGSWSGGAFNGANGAVNIVSINGAQFSLTGVKLEIGNVATPYNRQSLAKILADCQRYFETSYPDGYAPGAVTAAGGSQNFEQTSAASIVTRLVEVGYQTRKRAQPTLTFYSPTSGASGVVRNYTAGTDVAPAVNWTTQRGFGWSLSVTAVPVYNAVGQWTAAAEL